MATDRLLLARTVITATTVAELSPQPRNQNMVLAKLSGLGIGLAFSPPISDRAMQLVGYAALCLNVAAWMPCTAAIARRKLKHWSERPLRILGARTIAGAIMLVMAQSH
jgi:hypothetical protein